MFGSLMVKRSGPWQFERTLVSPCNDGVFRRFSADDPLISPVTSRPLAPPVVAALPSDAEAP